jgi:molybdopterin/thiamine biosynthesis adenylyltransferase
MKFDYNKTFSRNLGWFSRDEQKIISTKVIAIPGMGGVGGHHLHTLARHGYKHFKIADFDEFDVHNFNRQIGAKISTVGRPKAEVMKEMILDIIPDAQIDVFSDGVNSSNYEEFLNGVDVLVDGLDIYVIRPRIELYDLALSKGIYVISAGPLGMGTSIICFHPEKVNFSSYFNINVKMSDKDLIIHFLVGLAPKPIHMKYMIHKEEVNIEEGRIPSLHTGVLAATTAIGAEVTKIILGRGNVDFAPHTKHYDFYYNKLKKNWRPFGNRNPLQKVLIKVVNKHWDKLSN